MKSRKQHNNGPVTNRWPMEAWRDDPNGKCGFPVCAIVDAKPKRFRSMCQLVQYMKQENIIQRVLHIQKGDCADASKYLTYFKSSIHHAYFLIMNKCHEIILIRMMLIFS